MERLSVSIKLYALQYLLQTSILCHPFVSPNIVADTETFKYDSADLPFFTSWPLKMGFPGLVIKNLNEYISRFPHCLTVVQNHQGIEMVEVSNPIYLFRYDIEAKEMVDSDSNETSNNIYDFPFVKAPSLTGPKDITLALSGSINVRESRWTCYAQFDIFYPKKSDAFHFYF